MRATGREPALGEAKSPTFEKGEAVEKADPELRGHEARKFKNRKTK